MTAFTFFGVLSFGAGGLYWAVSYIVGNRTGLEKEDGRKRLKIQFAFWYAVLVLAAHRAAMTYMLLTMDFSKRDAQEFFGMSWWFLDPLAGFPIVLGSLPFAKNIPMPRFIDNYYIPLSILLYAGFIYWLWLLSRHAFAAPKPPERT